MTIFVRGLLRALRLLVATIAAAWLGGGLYMGLVFAFPDLFSAVADAVPLAEGESFAAAALFGFYFGFYMVIHIFGSSFGALCLAAVTTEALRLRALTWYLVIGIAIAFWSWRRETDFLADYPTEPVIRSLAEVPQQLAPVLIASGALGGLVYWWLAGRGAGRWWERVEGA